MNLSFALHVTLLVTAATLVAAWCGWGLARLTLPAPLRPFTPALAPLLGYALLVVAGYWGVWTVAGMQVATPVILVGAGLLNLIAWRRAAPPAPSDQAPARGEWLALATLLLATTLVGVAPLLAYGHPAAIGGGWDIESALATVRGLERGPVASIAAGPDNPLRDLVSNPPRIGKTLGFAIWQAAVDLLTRTEAFVTFAPLLAWLRALGVLATYLLLRATLGLRPWVALLGAAWVAAGALLLWTTYFNFEKQLAGWPLIPLGLLVGLAAVEDAAARGLRAWPALLGASVALAALPVTYYPALTIWGPLTIGIGIARLIEAARAPRDSARPEPSRPPALVAAAVGLLALTTLVAAPTVVDYFRGFAWRYDSQLTTLGVFRYIPASDVVGLTAFFPHEQATPPPSPAVLAGGVLLIALMAAGLAVGPRRTRWLGMLIGGLIYFAWLRWGQEYPYAYMKGASYAGFIFLGLAAAGVQGVADRLRRPVAIAAFALLPLALLALMGVAQARVVAAHWERPGLYPGDTPALLELRQVVPPGSSVTLTSDTRVQGVISGLAAYALDHAVVWGSVRTGYAQSRAGPPDAIGEYGLLHVSEDPLPWGYGGEPIWRGGSYALYRRPPTTLAHLRLLTSLEPGAEQPLSVGGERLAAGEEALAGGPPRVLALTISALDPGELDLGGVGVRLPAGRSQVRLPLDALPRALVVRNGGDATLLLESVTLLAEAAAGQPSVAALGPVAVVRATAVAEGTAMSVTLDALLAGGGPLTLALDVWDVRRGVQYGWYGALVGPGGPRRAVLTIDLASGAARGLDVAGSELPIGAQFVGLSRGQYVGRLQVSAGAQVLAEPFDLFGFDVDEDGTIGNVWGRDSGLLSTAMARPTQTVDALAGDDARLLGYTLGAAPARAGRPLNFTLWWEAARDGADERSVLVHLVDATGARRAQGDGPPAEGMRPTAQWRSGELIVDARRIDIPADLPPGRYELLVGLYRWPSLERVAMTADGERLVEDVVRIPLEVRRGES